MTKKQSTPAVHSLTLEQAHELIHKLLDRITELEDRLNQHSGNSSKPRPASDKTRGAQPGHKGQRRERHPHDARLPVEVYYPAPACPCCGGKVLAHDKPYRAHQVFESPPAPSTPYSLKMRQLLEVS